MSKRKVPETTADVTPEKAAAEETAEPKVRLTVEALQTAFSELPKGTRERDAFNELGYGWNRKAFREQWLRFVGGTVTKEAGDK